MFKDVIFYLVWYYPIRWSSPICKKSSFLSFYSFLVKFSEWHREVVEQNWQSVTKLNRVKKAIMQVTFWMDPCLICYFIFILFYTERKWLLMRNLPIILPLKSKLSGNFSVSILLMKVSECWKIVEFRKISIKMKNCKTFYETQTASRLKEIIKLPPPPCYQIKSYYVFVTKIFSGRYTETYRHLLSKCFKNVDFGVRDWCSANVFSDAKQKHVCWKICKVRKAFGCASGTYYFQCQVSWGS